MGEFIYPIFVFLVDLPVNINVPVNFWLWLLPTVALLLVFCVGVERSAISHIGRVVLAIGMTYILLNLSVHTKQSFDWQDYLECQKNSIHRYMSPEMYKECSHHVDIADGAKNVFTLGFRWIPAAAYVGIWEALWRIKHRKKIKEMGKSYKGKWFSNVTIGLIIFPFFAFFFLGSGPINLIHSALANFVSEEAQSCRKYEYFQGFATYSETKFAVPFGFSGEGPSGKK